MLYCHSLIYFRFLFANGPCLSLTCIVHRQVPKKGPCLEAQANFRRVPHLEFDPQGSPLICPLVLLGLDPSATTVCFAITLGIAQAQISQLVFGWSMPDLASELVQLDPTFPLVDFFSGVQINDRCS
jgi:hypothetical protein